MLHVTRTPLVILVHGVGAPSGDDWNDYLGALRAAVNHPACSILVVADSSGPTAVQRDQLGKVVPGRVRTAVVTTSAWSRNLVTLISWFHPNIRAYAPGDIERAFEYLSVPKLERPLVLKTIAALRAQLSGIGVASENEALAMLRETAIEPMDAVVARLGSLRAQLATRRR